MTEYHTRHPEKAIEDQDEIISVIDSQRLLTIAMSVDDEPYLVTVNYGYDPEERCFYFHCATNGKKIDYLKANPVVWCQIMEDRGYVQTECEHHFRTVQFRGEAEVLTDFDEIRKALALLIEQQEDEPDPVKERLLAKVKPGKLSMVRIRAGEFSGKRND